MGGIRGAHGGLGCLGCLLGPLLRKVVLGGAVLGSIGLGGGFVPVTCGVPSLFDCFPSIFAGEHGVWLRSMSCTHWPPSLRLRVIRSRCALPGGWVVAFRVESVVGVKALT